MGKIVLSLPTNFFTNDFLDMEAKKGLGVRGDMLPYHLKESQKRQVHMDKRQKGLFDHNMIYCCKSIKNRVLLVGTIV